MSELKTKPNSLSVIEFIDNHPNQKINQDCKELIKFYESATGYKAKLWAHMIGFGSYDYKYETGRSGTAMMAGFAPSKVGITLYLNCSGREMEKKLAKLGKHKMSVSCLYIKNLASIDYNILKEIIIENIKYMRDNYKTYKTP